MNPFLKAATIMAGTCLAIVFLLETLWETTDNRKEHNEYLRP